MILQMGNVIISIYPRDCFASSETILIPLATSRRGKLIENRCKKRKHHISKLLIGHFQSNRFILPQNFMFISLIKEVCMLIKNY